MKKITSALLLVAMLLSLAACGETDTTDETTADTTGTVDTTETETEETRTPHQVPDTLDFGGATFNIAYPEWQGYRFYFFADEATGDAMNDAIFQRTILVEDYLNVDITQYSPGYIADVVADVKKTINAGDDIYQLALLHCIQGVSELVTGGMMYNFDTLPYVSLDADWWNREQMDVLRLGENTYYGVSDYMIPCPYAIYFNKDIVRDYNMDDPYQLVYEGNWTLDKFVDMAVEFTRDVDGDGKYNEDIDNFGLSATETSKYVSFLTGCDQYLTERGADGKVQLALNTEKTHTIIETMHKLMEKAGTIYLTTAEDESAQFDFASGKLLFRLDTIASAVLFRDYEADIGIVPYPKFDTEQENYISMDWGGLMGIPTTIGDPDMVGAVLELLSWYSADTVIPAYYDVLLDGKLARDEDTTAMVDILFDTITYEIGVNYFGFSGGFSSMYNPINEVVIVANSTDFASWYAKKEKSAQSTIDSFYKALDKIEK